MSRSIMLRALGFAHLAGFAGKNARAEEDDDQDDKPQGRRADDDDDTEPKSRKAKGEDDDTKPDDEDDEPKGKAKGSRAEGDDDEEDEEDEDGNPKGRRTAAEDDDEDKEEREAEEDDADPKARAARKRERARCAAIFGSKHAAGRVASAAHLAFNTKMTASAAICVLKTLPKEQAAGGGLGARMDAYGGHRPSASAPPAPSTRQNAAASWDKAAQRAGIVRK